MQTKEGSDLPHLVSSSIIPENLSSKEGLNQPNSNQNSENYSRTEIKSVFESPQQSSAKEGEPVGSQSPIKKTQNILKRQSTIMQMPPKKIQYFKIKMRILFSKTYASRNLKMGN